MSLELAIAAVFLSVALVAGLVASWALARTAPERRRLRAIAAQPGGTGLIIENPQLTEAPSATVSRIATVIPKSPKELSRLRRRLARAGYRSLTAAVLYSLAEFITPLAVGGMILLVVDGQVRWLLAGVGAVIGYLLPGLVLERLITRRKKMISNGLPDALDLMIVCLEAGSALDQAIVKASEELALAYPALAEELKLINIETRAGKPRLEAFKNFADRTQVDDVRALVAMLVQTDRFGTSVADALRTHAETSRTKRRQRAEERAAKVSVKLVFPLVFCLFPAFYVVTMGAAVIKLLRFLTQGQIGPIGP
jgi:tight adherence protein C